MVLNVHSIDALIFRILGDNSLPYHCKLKCLCNTEEVLSLEGSTTDKTTVYILL